MVSAADASLARAGQQVSGPSRRFPCPRSQLAGRTSRYSRPGRHVGVSSYSVKRAGAAGELYRSGGALRSNRLRQEAWERGM